MVYLFHYSGTYIFTRIKAEISYKDWKLPWYIGGTLIVEKAYAMIPLARVT